MSVVVVGTMKPPLATMSISEQWQLIINGTDEQRLRDSTINLYLNDGVILALILSLVSLDRVDAPHENNVFAMAKGNAVVEPAGDVLQLLGMLAVFTGAIGLLYTLHTAGELNGVPDAKKWLIEMGPFRAVAVCVLCANASIWLFLVSSVIRVSLMSTAWVGIIAFSLLPLGIILAVKLAVSPTTAKLRQLSDLQRDTA